MLIHIVRAGLSVRVRLFVCVRLCVLLFRHIGLICTREVRLSGSTTKADVKQRRVIIVTGCDALAFKCFFRSRVEGSLNYVCLILKEFGFVLFYAIYICNKPIKFKCAKCNC